MTNYSISLSETLIWQETNVVLGPITGRDFSGNARHLSANGTVERTGVSNATAERYGRGYTFDGVNDYLMNEDSFVYGLADLSVTKVFQLDNNLDRHTLIDILGNPQPNNHNLWVSVDSGFLRVKIDDDGNNELMDFTSITPITVGDVHTLTVRRDNTLKTLVAKVDGTVHILTTYTGTPNTEADRVYMGRDGNNIVDSSNLVGALFETRLWDYLVPQLVLDEIVDPLAFTYHGVAEGTEFAYWPFEEYMVTADSITVTLQLNPYPELYYGITDNAVTALSTGAGSVATTLTVNDGTVFDDAEIPFIITVADAITDLNSEKMIVRSVVGNTLTVERGFQSDAVIHGAGSTVSIRVIAQHIRDLVENSIHQIQSNSYMEHTFNGSLQITQSTVWANATKVAKLAQVTYIYPDTFTKLPTQATRIIYYKNGVTVRRTEVTDFVWQYGKLVNTTKVVDLTWA